MVWVQLALIPIVYIMMWAVEGKPYIWRWNLLAWFMLAGYLIGILALPLSHGLVVYAEYGLGNEQTFDDETNIYSFGRDTKGWTGVGSLKDPSIKKDVQYFQWTFTTENYTVIYTSGNATEGYRLIKKLTPTEMWLQWSAQDPVLYPNQTTTFYKLKARKRQ